MLVSYVVSEVWFRQAYQTRSTATPQTQEARSAALPLQGLWQIHRISCNKELASWCFEGEPVRVKPGEPVGAKVWVLCHSCDGKHRVIPGVGAPVYWCGGRLMSLKDGDDVEYEENGDGR